MDQRLDERNEIKRLLDQRKSIQMLAPRRVGKTWLMHKVEEDLKQAGWATIFIDVEGMRAEEEFWRALCDKLELAGTFTKKLHSSFLERVKRITSGNWDGSWAGILGKIDHKIFSDALIASLNEQHGTALILIDEIALFVLARLEEDPSATHDFLYHLRKLRQAYPNVRWIFTGSIGLEAVARRASIQGSLVDMEIFSLEPFSTAAAQAYVQRLCFNKLVRRPFYLDEKSLAYLAEQLGWLSPYYIEIIANRIIPTGPVDKSGLPLALPADVDAAFEELLAPAYRGYFAAWEEHIKKNFQKTEVEILHKILEICCAKVEGEKLDTLLSQLTQAQLTIPKATLRDLLDRLEVDGFLIVKSERWQFRSGLLRRYWLRYYC